MRSRLVLGLDFGGTKLAAGVVDLAARRITDSAFCSTRVEAGAEGAVSDMIEMASQLKDADRVAAIGVCFGGYAANNHIMKSLHVPGWDHYPIHDRLNARFENVPVYVANDANAVALGEFKYGAGQGSRSMLFLTVSTGVGGGLILDGQLWEGPNGLAGEIGHMRAVPEGGDLCNCGRYGCVESVSAGPSMVRRARALLDSQPDVSSQLRHLPGFTARDLDQLAASGDTVAARFLIEGARYLGIAIGNVINLLDVDSVIIGGGVSRSGELWWSTIRNTVAEITLPWRPSVELRPSALGTHEGIWGAVALLPENE